MTIFVRQFVPIVIVVALTLVPVTVLEAFASPHSGRAWSDLASMIGSAGDPAASRQAAQQLQDINGNTALALLTSLIALVVRPLMWSAIVAVVAGAYAGSRVTVAQAYAVGMRCWLSQIVVGLAFAVMALVALVPVIIAYVLVVLVVAALAALHLTAATIAVGVLFGLAVLAAFAIVGSWVLMAYELATVAVVTEDANPVTAISIALRRAFAPGMKRRTVVGGLVVFAISWVGTIPIFGLGTLVQAITHVDVLYFAIFGTGSVLLEGVVAAFIIVFAIDIRVRREGLDILSAAAPAAGRV